MTILNKSFSLLFLFTFSLFASDVLTNYRLNGIQNIEKELDYELAQKEYWDSYLKTKETKFGYIESYENVLTCDKSKSTLTLYIKDKNNSYKMKKQYGAFTGKAKGDKIQEGDLKTPVGIYNLTKKLSNVDSFYGPLAFVTSYPNLYDIYKGKNGSGIWIHGLPQQERDEFTKGCIAINNDNLECLDRNIEISKTVLIVNEENIATDISKENLSSLLSQLYMWRYTWLYNDIAGYLGFYASEFRRHDGMHRDDFARYKTRVFDKQESKTIIFTDLNVIPYPGAEDTYKISFKEMYKSNSYSFFGDKILIVKLKNDKLQIITEL
jgi:murein L,D-transpeptidase YafK